MMKPNHVYRHSNCLDVDFKCVYTTGLYVGLIPVYRPEDHPVLGKSYVEGSGAYDKPKDMSQWTDVTEMYRGKVDK